MRIAVTRGSAAMVGGGVLLRGPKAGEEGVETEPEALETDEEVVERMRPPGEDVPRLRLVRNGQAVWCARRRAEVQI